MTARTGSPPEPSLSAALTAADATLGFLADATKAARASRAALARALRANNPSRDQLFAVAGAADLAAKSAAAAAVPAAAARNRAVLAVVDSSPRGTEPVLAAEMGVSRARVNQWAAAGRRGR